MQVLVVGGIVLDMTFNVPTWPQPAGAVHSDRAILSPGGKGLNQAVAAQRLGTSVALVGCVGRDYSGDLLLNALKDEGVDTSFIQRHPDAATGVVAMLVQDTVPGFIGAPGASKELTIDDVRAAVAHITPETVVIVTYDSAQEVVAFVLEQAKKRGATTILNPAPLNQPLPGDTAYWPHVDYLLPNSHEARYITGQHIVNVTTLGRDLLALGVGAVCITRGTEGSVFMNHESFIDVPAPQVNVQDTTGASDAFVGAFAAGLVWRWPYKRILRFAVAAGTLTCTDYGVLPALPGFEAVTALMRQQPENG